MAAYIMFKEGPAWTRASTRFREDITQALDVLRSLPVHWEGKASVLELKEADYNSTGQAASKLPQNFQLKSFARFSPTQQSRETWCSTRS